MQSLWRCFGIVKYQPSSFFSSSSLSTPPFGSRCVNEIEAYKRHTLDRRCQPAARMLFLVPFANFRSVIEPSLAVICYLSSYIYLRIYPKLIYFRYCFLIDSNVLSFLFLTVKVSTLSYLFVSFFLYSFYFLFCIFLFLLFFNKFLPTRSAKRIDIKSLRELRQQYRLTEPLVWSYPMLRVEYCHSWIIQEQYEWHLIAHNIPVGESSIEQLYLNFKHGTFVTT